MDLTRVWELLWRCATQTPGPGKQLIRSLPSHPLTVYISISLSLSLYISLSLYLSLSISLYLSLYIWREIFGSRTEAKHGVQWCPKLRQSQSPYAVTHYVWDWNLPANRVRNITCETGIYLQTAYRPGTFCLTFYFAVIIPVINIEFTGWDKFPGLTSLPSTLTVKKVQEDNIFGRQDILQYFSKVSKNYKTPKTG